MPNNFSQQDRQNLLNALGQGRALAIGARRLAQNYLENRTRSDNDRRTALINSWNNQGNHQTTR